ncbi:MaoC family dehydratase [Caenimonas soli]|uniref:MaoC family dehydratase n=1 Tax=Caenimonas soli TaxID=2735555 RepID=UPI001557C169|nr:MaoC family dehydratase [Caenimonas soli]NPC55635.1 MaoC family dehydratase [Caenimonas soli]
MKIGRTYDALNVGDSESFTRTVTETDIQLFAGMTGDFNPIHTDIEYAKTSRFGQRVAHGPIALSLVAYLVGMRLPGPGTILLRQDARYLAPVFIGDTITVTLTVVEKAPKGRVVMDASYVNQRGETVIESQVEGLPPRAPVAA